MTLKTFMAPDMTAGQFNTFMEFTFENKVFQTYSLW